MKHCGNLKADRKLGELWERNFCKLAARHGLTFTPMQIGRAESAQAYSIQNGKWNSLTLPDITVWTAPGQHHEIKHKNPTSHGSFGLEVYRFNALIAFAQETGQDVMYTIHNHDLCGGRNTTVNKIEHWFTVNVLDLPGRHSFLSKNGSSYVSGVKTKVPIFYWQTDLWTPLAEYWANSV